MPTVKRERTRDPATRPAADASDPSADFQRLCAAAGIEPGICTVLWQLCPRFPGDASEQHRQVLEDHAHFRLFEASRQGDAGAAAVFERTWRRYLGAYLGGRFTPDQVEEMTALFFDRVYRLAAARFRFECPFAVYLRTIALNLARTQVRRIAIRRAREVSLDKEESGFHETLPGHDPTPEERLLRAERDRALEHALGELDPADLHILRRCLLDGESGNEVAAALGIRRDALYQRINRAKKRLRSLLATAGHSPVAATRAVSEPSRRRVLRGNEH